MRKLILFISMVVMACACGTVNSNDFNPHLNGLWKGRNAISDSVYYIVYGKSNYPNVKRCAEFYDHSDQPQEISETDIKLVHKKSHYYDMEVNGKIRKRDISIRKVANNSVETIVDGATTTWKRSGANLSGFKACIKNAEKGG